MARTPPSFGGGWVVVRTKARRENWAAQNIVRQGLEVYSPTVVLPRRRRGQPSREALFPGYLFANASTGQWRFLTGTYGVLALIMSGGVPAVMASQEIERMRAMEDEEGNVVLPDYAVDHPPPRPGDQVRVREGLFADYVGICSDSPAPDRTRVLLEFMGGRVPFLFDTRDLDALG